MKIKLLVLIVGLFCSVIKGDDFIQLIQLNDKYNISELNNSVIKKIFGFRWKCDLRDVVYYTKTKNKLVHGYLIYSSCNKNIYLLDDDKMFCNKIAVDNIESVYGVDVLPNDNIVIADGIANRVVIININGDSAEVVSKYNYIKGYLKKPSCVVADDNGTAELYDDGVVIADQNNNRILKIDSNGELVYELQTYGKYQNKINKPLQVAKINCPNERYLYVLEGSRILRFRESKNKIYYINSIENDKLHYSDIAVDGNDYIYVTENRYGGLYKYDKKLNLIDKLGSDIIGKPNCIYINKYNNIGLLVNEMTDTTGVVAFRLNMGILEFDTVKNRINRNNKYSGVWVKYKLSSKDHFCIRIVDGNNVIIDTLYLKSKALIKDSVWWGGIDKNNRMVPVGLYKIEGLYANDEIKQVVQCSIYVTEANEVLGSVTDFNGYFKNGNNYLKWTIEKSLGIKKYIIEYRKLSSNNWKAIDIPSGINEFNIICDSMQCHYVFRFSILYDAGYKKTSDKSLVIYQFNDNLHKSTRNTNRDNMDWPIISLEKSMNYRNVSVFQECVSRKYKSSDGVRYKMLIGSLNRIFNNDSKFVISIFNREVIKSNNRNSVIRIKYAVEQESGAIKKSSLDIELIKEGCSWQIVGGGSIIDMVI